LTNVFDYNKYESTAHAPALDWANRTSCYTAMRLSKQPLAVHWQGQRE